MHAPALAALPLACALAAPAPALETILPIQEVVGSGPDADAADVAWDANTRRMCIVWRTDLSAVSNYRLEIYEEDGTPVFGFSLGTTPNPACEPAVCSLSAEGLFVVAHPQRYSWGVEVELLGIHVAAPWLYVTGTVPAPGLDELDLGGDPLEESAQVCLVWGDQHGIRGQRLAVHGYDFEPVEEPFTLEEGAHLENRYPRISQSNGPAGNWLVVWENTSIGTGEVHGAVVPRSGAVGLPYSWLYGASRPSCDGDGSRFLIACATDHGKAIDGLEVQIGPGTALSVLAYEQPHVDPSHPLSTPQVAITLDGLDDAFAVSWLRSDFPVLSRTAQLKTYDASLAPISPLVDVESECRGLRVASLRAADFYAPPSDWITLVFPRPSGVYFTIEAP